MTRHLLAGLALACAAALTGCGDEATDAGEAPASASESPSSAAPEPAEPTSDPAENLPDCAEIWVDGKTLPDAYDGCNDDGDLVAADPLGCSSGQTFMRHLDRYYGVLGGTITDVGDGGLEADQRYLDDIVTCRA